MAGNKAELLHFWHSIPQVVQLAELTGNPLGALIDEWANEGKELNLPWAEGLLGAEALLKAAEGWRFLAGSAKPPLPFHLWLLHKSVAVVPEIVRLCPRPFFDLMDLEALLSGQTETRDEAAWVAAAPLIHPLSGTASVAQIVWKELVYDSPQKELLTFQRFEEYVDALCKTEFATSYAEHWALIKQQCELSPQEKCVLYTPYAADCSQFPPAVGSLYLSAEHLVFQDPVLHNRRLISLNTVTDVRRVPVELRHAKELLSQLPGFSLLVKGSLVGGLARWAGLTKGVETNLVGSPAIPASEAGSTAVRDTEYWDDNGITASPAVNNGSTPSSVHGSMTTSNGSGASNKPPAGGVEWQSGLSAVLIRWSGGGMAKFMFVEISGSLCNQWLRHLQEVVLAHKLAKARAEKENYPLPINVFEAHVPWLPAFVAENMQRAQALESMLGKEVPTLFICSQGANRGFDGGGPLVEDLYRSYKAAHRYRKEEELGKSMDIFNFKTLDDNLVKLDELSQDLLETLKEIDSLFLWHRPVYSAGALGACLTVFYYDALSLCVPAMLLAIAGRTAYQGILSSWRRKLLLNRAFPSPPASKTPAPSRQISDLEDRANVVEAQGDGAVVASTSSQHAISASGLRNLNENSRQNHGVEGTPVTTRIEENSEMANGSSSFLSPESSSNNLDDTRSVEGSIGSVEGEQSGLNGSQQLTETPNTVTPNKSFFGRIGERVIAVRNLRKNVRKMLQDRVVQVERQLQVGLQVGREKTQKLSQLQNSIQQINRLLAKLAVLHSWEHPRQSWNYVILVATAGTTLAMIPPRWLFLAAVIGKFTPGDSLTKRLKGAAITLSQKYLEPPDEQPKTPRAPDS